MVICFVVTYSSAVWRTRVRSDLAERESTKFQQMVCIAMTGSIRITPTAIYYTTLVIFMGLLLLSMGIEAEAIICMKRLTILT